MTELHLSTSTNLLDEAAEASTAGLVQAIDWNAIVDKVDKQVNDQLGAHFWLASKMTISNDKDSWRLLSPVEQDVTMKVFTGLTLLDTVQGRVGVPALLPFSSTDHEGANLLVIAQQEVVHAQSYSMVFHTLATKQQREEAFRWSRLSPELQEKSRIVQEIYASGDEHKMRIVSVFLEAFQFYSGFFWPLWLNVNGKLTNTGDMIRLILRDEALHGSYIGYKFDNAFRELPVEQQDELRDWAGDLLAQLYSVEERYAQSIYDAVNLTEKVKAFMRFNANRAMQILGFDPIFDTEEQPDPRVMTSLSLHGENHDFFSGQGSSYVMAEVEPTTTPDWRPQDWVTGSDGQFVFDDATA